MESRPPVNNHIRSDIETTSKSPGISRILFWIGGLYGIIMGLFVALGPTYEYRTSTGYHGYASLLQAQGFPVAFAVIVIALLLFAGSLILFTKKRWNLIIALLVAQAILEVLSLPSMGLLFIPATVLLAVATALQWSYH